MLPRLLGAAARRRQSALRGFPVARPRYAPGAERLAGGLILTKRKAGSALPALGDSAPSFSGVTDADQTLALSDLRGSWVILFFYPKDDTPG